MILYMLVLIFLILFSMIGLWSLVGLHLCIWSLRWWRLLQLYACFNIILLYVYQLPVNFPSMFQWMADFVGLFKVSSNTEWPEICAGFSLILFYIMVCTVHLDTWSSLFKVSWEITGRSKNDYLISFKFLVLQVIFGLIIF